MLISELEWQDIEPAAGERAIINRDFHVWRNRDGTFELVDRRDGYVTKEIGALELQALLFEYAKPDRHA